MCGIAGVVVSNNHLIQSVERIVSIIDQTTNSQKHRGPDDGGIEVVHNAIPYAVFGHRRLSIIDLSPSGHQPMCDLETGNWITFNGEIYNFRELRNELEAAGQQFSSGTDTEVILKAYALWGMATIQRLRGIFAFGLWDTKRHRLLLVRDQLGVKPLYFWHNRDTLLFASEVRALLASDLIPRKLDFHGLRSFLAYGSVQEPLTLVSGIRSLLPGHVLTWQDENIQIERYWQLPSPEAVVFPPPSDILDQVAGRLFDAVRSQLVADVPLGAFLSGGIDSTVIAALMKRGFGGPVRTFSVVFDEKQYDERNYAQMAARHIGTEHTELLLRGEDVRNALPDALTAFDQPSIDGLNTYFVSKITRNAGLTVALSGLGGDEIFGGYEGYAKPLLLEKWGTRLRRIPLPVRVGLSKVINRCARQEPMRKLASLLSSQHHPYFTTRQVFDQWQVSRFLLPDILRRSYNWEPDTYSQLEKETVAFDPINRVSALEIQTYMLSTLLRDTDQMSMAHALEVRVPFLDHLLVEYLFTLPGDCKLESGQPKPLLTRTMNGDLPDACVYRPKRGFELPFDIWLRSALTKDIEECLIVQSEIDALPFTENGLKAIWSQFQCGSLNWSRVWAIFVLRHWIQTNMIESC